MGGLERAPQAPRASRPGKAGALREQVRGPARLVFARPVAVIPGRGRLIVRHAEGHRLRNGERLCEVIELADGQVAEVRP